MATPNAQGIMGLMSQGQAPQPPVPSPMKASPMAGLGSVESRVAAYRGNPAPLQQRYAVTQDLLDLLALQKIKSEKDAAARQMQMQLASQQASEGMAPMTVAQQREREVMDMTRQELARQRGKTAQQQTSEQQAALQRAMSGIAQAPGAEAAAEPQAMAAGGIVAFEEGGSTLDAARERRRAAQEAVYKFGLRQRQQNPEGFDAAQQELRAAETALEDAKQAYAAEMMTAGVARPVTGRQGVTAAPFAASAMPSVEGVAPAQPPTAQPPATQLPTARPVLPESGDEVQFGAPRGLPRPPVPPRPAVPRPAPAAVAAPRPAPAAAPAMPEVAMIPGLKESIERDVALDPEEAQRRQEERARAAFALTPEQRARAEQSLAEIEKARAEYSRPKPIDQGIVSFLLGMGGRGPGYGAFGPGARAAQAYDEDRRRALDEYTKEIGARRTALTSLEREGIKPSIEAGIKGLEQARLGRTGAQSTGDRAYGADVQARTATLDRASRERDNALMREVQMAQIAAQRAATAANQEEMNFARMQGHLTTVVTNRQRAVEAINKRYAREQEQVALMLQTNPKDPVAQQKAKDVETRRLAELDASTKEFDSAQAIIESRMYGKAGDPSASSFIVTERPK